MKNRDFRVTFLYEFKLGHKASKQTLHYQFKMIRSKDTSLENKGYVKIQLVVDDDQLKAPTEAKYM